MKIYFKLRQGPMSRVRQVCYTVLIILYVAVLLLAAELRGIDPGHYPGYLLVLCFGVGLFLTIVDCLNIKKG